MGKITLDGAEYEENEVKGALKAIKDGKAWEAKHHQRGQELNRKEQELNAKMEMLTNIMSNFNPQQSQARQPQMEDPFAIPDFGQYQNQPNFDDVDPIKELQTLRGAYSKLAQMNKALISEVAPIIEERKAQIAERQQVSALQNFTNAVRQEIQARGLDIDPDLAVGKIVSAATSNPALARMNPTALLDAVIPQTAPQAQTAETNTATTPKTDQTPTLLSGGKSPALPSESALPDIGSNADIEQVASMLAQT